MKTDNNRHQFYLKNQILFLKKYGLKRKKSKRQTKFQIDI